MVQPALQTKKLHIGCGRNIMADWVNLDCIAGPGIDCVADLDACATTALPFEDDMFDEVYASHLIEHIKNPLPMLQELHRVCVDGAKATFRCPHGANDDAFEDPTHFRQYFPNSFMYFSQPAYWRADYGYRGDWQPETIQLVVSGQRWRTSSPQDLIFAVQNLRNVVLELIVTMRAVKPIREAKRELIQMPTPEVVFMD
ncbi:MAG TPA: methyltransferase domain-containing protein [Fimbriimonadaceae bacterium]|nr:methyltransferase domain-containing protein [Fimbriimonadaceae bacterium]